MFNNNIQLKFSDNVSHLWSSIILSYNLNDKMDIINPRCMRRRVTVLGLSVCLSVCPHTNLELFIRVVKDLNCKDKSILYTFPFVNPLRLISSKVTVFLSMVAYYGHCRLPH